MYEEQRSRLMLPSAERSDRRSSAAVFHVLLHVFISRPKASPDDSCTATFFQRQVLTSSVQLLLGVTTLIPRLFQKQISKCTKCEQRRAIAQLSFMFLLTFLSRVRRQVLTTNVQLRFREIALLRIKDFCHRFILWVS